MAFSNPGLRDELQPITNLRLLRLYRRMSQARLAKLAGLKQEYVSALERGMRPSKGIHVVRLAAALGVTPDVLTADQLVPLVLTPNSGTPHAGA